MRFFPGLLVANMNNNFGATDLTMSDRLIESSNGPSPSKRPKVELPFASPSGSDNNAPVLEPAVPVPNFNLAEVAETCLATSPPFLQPEIELPASSSLAKDCQPSTSKSVKPGPQTAIPAIAAQKPEERHIVMMPSFKKSHRLSKVSNSLASSNVELLEKLAKTRVYLKENPEGGSQKNGEKKKLKRTKKVRNNPGQTMQTKRGKRNTTSVITPEEEKILEVRYAANPNPAPGVDVHLIALELGLTSKDVLKWFQARKRQVGVKTHEFPASGLSDAPGASTNAMKSQGLNLHIVQSVPDSDGHDHHRRDDIVQQNLDDKPDDSSPGIDKLKFLRTPELRTDDLEVIKTDVDNVKWYPLKKFRPLLEKNWEVKADLLLEMITTEGFGFKKNIYKESKRLTRIALDLFSDEQERAVLKWKRTFIGKKVEEGKFGDYATVKNVVEETVVPWIAPFMYSRITRQDDRNLSLEVALHDFCKMSNGLADVTSRPIEWITPGLF